MRRNMYGVHKATGTKKILNKSFKKGFLVLQPKKIGNFFSKFQVEFRVQCNSNERRSMSEV